MKRKYKRLEASWNVLPNIIRSYYKKLVYQTISVDSGTHTRWSTAHDPHLEGPYNLKNLKKKFY